MIILYLTVYILTLYVAYLATKRLDMNEEVGFKGKTLVMIWFTFFITSQMLMINEVFKWFGMGL